MEFLNFLTPEYATALISQAAQSDLSEYLIVVAVVWRVMGKKVANHFKSIESAVTNVAAEVKSLKDAVTADLKTQSSRLEAVENGMLELHNRVSQLETTKEK